MADRVVHKTYHDNLFELAVLFGVLQAILLWWFVPQINPVLFIIIVIIMYPAGNVSEPDMDQIGLTGGDGDMLRLKTVKGKLPVRVMVGFVGLLLATWSFWYAWIVGWFGGHRSWLSHGWVIGTLGRMVWWNIPVFLLVEQYCVMMGWPIETWFYEMYGEYWVLTYLVAQFSAWFMGDAVHLVLDTEWAKRYLYVPVSKRKKNSKVILIQIPQIIGTIKQIKRKSRRRYNAS